MSECYFHVKAVYGVTEDCFEIESRKSPSLFIIIIIIIIINSSSSSSSGSGSSGSSSSSIRLN